MANVRYVLIVLVICIAGYGALFLFGRSSAYCALTKGYSDLSPCYKYFVTGQDADILLVGDSSLLYGVKPEVVEKVSGRSSYNDGIVGPVFAFAPDKVIGQYLAANKRPRAVIVYLSPWDTVEPGVIHDEVWFPLGLAAMQHGSLGDLLSVFRARPSAIVEIPPIILRSTGRDRGPNAAMRAQMEATGGHFDYDATLSDDRRALAPCPANGRQGPVPKTGPSRTALAALKATMAAQGIPLYVYAAPFAGCGTDVAAVKAAYAGLSDNVPTALPDRLFANEAGKVGTYVHVNANGADAVSTLLGRFIVEKGIGK